jgi:hypothetical protein
MKFHINGIFNGTYEARQTRYSSSSLNILQTFMSIFTPTCKAQRVIQCKFKLTSKDVVNHTNSMCRIGRRDWLHAINGLSIEDNMSVFLFDHACSRSNSTPTFDKLSSLIMKRLPFFNDANHNLIAETARPFNCNHSEHELHKSPH